MSVDLSRFDLAAVPVLVVDRSRFMRSLVSDLLRAVGIERIATAETTPEARSAIAATRPKIAFVEREMRPVDGVAFTRWVRTDPASPDPRLPIVLMTASNLEADILAARDAGATEIVIKPVSPRAIYSRINVILSGARTFVESTAYVGPCRRRRREDGYRGPLKRLDDDTLEVGGAATANVYAQIARDLAELGALSRSLTPHDRNLLRGLIELTERAVVLARQGGDPTLALAGESLTRYIRGVGASGKLQTNVVQMHLAAMSRLTELIDQGESSRRDIVEGLVEMVDRRLKAAA